MNDIDKSEIRNYLSAAGFVVLALHFLCISPLFAAVAENLNAIHLYLGFALITVGIILAGMKHRDLSAITFVLIGSIFVCYALAFSGGAAEHYSNLIVGVFFVILSLIILTAADRKKYLIASMPFVIGLENICVGLFVSGSGVGLEIISLAGFIFAVYFALAVAGERIRLPLGDVLKSDAAADFKSAGSVLGYLLIGMIGALYGFSYFLGSEAVNYDVIASMNATMCLGLCGIAVLLWTIGQMKYTPAMFFMFGIVSFTATLIPISHAMLIPFILFLLVAVITLLRKESRVLVAVLLFLKSMCYLLLAVFAGTAGMPALQGTVNILIAVTAVYLAFAVFSRSKKLPLF